MISITVFLDSAKYEDIDPVASIQKQISITPNWGRGRFGLCFKLTLELEETLLADFFLLSAVNETGTRGGINNGAGIETLFFDLGWTPFEFLFSAAILSLEAFLFLAYF